MYLQCVTYLVLACPLHIIHKIQYNSRSKLYIRAIQLVCNGGQFMKSIPNERPERYGLQYEWWHNSNIGAHMLYFYTIRHPRLFSYIKTCSYVVFWNRITTCELRYAKCWCPQFAMPLLMCLFIWLIIVKKTVLNKLCNHSPCNSIKM